MFKRSLKRVSLVCLVVLVSGMIALAALSVAYCIPTGRMYRNLEESVRTFRQEGQYPYTIPKYTNSRIDNFSDALMLNTAIFDDPDVSPLQRAVHTYHRRIQSTPTEQTEALITLLEDGAEDLELSDYSRYWHGYLILLRPLLCFFNYDDLRVIMCMAQIGLIAAVIYLLCKRDRACLLVALVGYILTISPTGTVLCLEFFYVHAITLTVCILLLLFETRMSDAACEWFFLFVGMATSFIDLLTFPAVSFGVPFCLLFCLRPRASFKDALLFFIRCGVMWCAGYLGLWVTKWLYGTLLSDASVFACAIEELLYRTSGFVRDSQPISRARVIELNLAVFSTKSIYCKVAAAILFIGILRQAIAKGVSFLAQPAILIFLMIAVIPFAWWAAAPNHAFVHPWLTHRSFSITVFSVLACLFDKGPRKLPDVSQAGASGAGGEHARD